MKDGSMKDILATLGLKTVAIITAGGVTGGLLIGGGILISNGLNDLISKKYIESMNSKGEYISYYKEANKNYAIEYIDLETIVNEAGNEEYIVPDGYHLIQDERGESVGVIIYEVVYLNDGQKLLYPVEETQTKHVKIRR